MYSHHLLHSCLQLNFLKADERAQSHIHENLTHTFTAIKENPIARLKSLNNGLQTFFNNLQLQEGLYRSTIIVNFVQPLIIKGCTKLTNLLKICQVGRELLAIPSLRFNIGSISLVGIQEKPGTCQWTTVYFSEIQC